MSTHLSLAHELVVSEQPEGMFWCCERPTFLVAIGMYGTWALLVLFHDTISWPLLMVAGGYMFWLSISPRSTRPSTAGAPSRLGCATPIVWPPTSGWFPFKLYKRAHIAHHRNTVLTFPGEDTESAYRKQAD